ncbi:MAG: Rho termination factor N-terminal domain-containing protein [Thermodesulfobacteriota bacterium]
MTVTEVRRKAKELGIKAGNMKKADLIRAIQTAEGNSNCFGQASENCVQENCCWKKDCLAK